MSTLLQFSLGRRLALIIWGSAFLFLGLSGCVLFYLQLSAIRDNARAALTPLAQLVSVGAEAAIDFEYPARAEEVLMSLKANPSILDARILLTNGEVLARYASSPVLGKVDLENLDSGIHFINGLAICTQDLKRGPATVAKLQIAMSMAPLYAQLLNSVWLYLAVLLFLLTLTLLQLRLIRQSIINPITSLASVADDIGRHADYQARVRIQGKDEIARLAHSFNAMLNVLQRREETLRLITRFQKTLIDNAPHGIISTTREGIITSINPAATRITGYRAEDLVGLCSPECFHDPAEVAERSAALSRQLGREIPPGIHAFFTQETMTAWSEKEWTYIRKDRTRVRVLLSVSALQDDNGQITGYVGMVTDISERMHAEENRLRLEAQLRQSQKMEAIGTLAGGIAHDFNNILTGILGNAELACCDIPEDHPARECLSELLNATHRARALVARILTFSRHHEQQRTVIHLWPVVSEALNLLRASLPSNIEILTHIDDSCPPVLADAGQMHQVLMNLCTNAAHAMAPRGGKLTLSLERAFIDKSGPSAEDLPSGPHLLLSIGDTGHGMDAATLERIFDPFFTTKPAGQGTGLGLSVVHGIVQKHEGILEVDSKPGEGTVFRIYLPASSAPVQEHTTKPPEQKQGSGELILVVDDETQITRLASRTLSRAGYRVQTSNDPTDALNLFRASPSDYAAVITDLTMPGLSGVELAAELLKIKPELPIILCTGFGAGMDAGRALELGFRGLLHKPFTNHDLLEMLHPLARREAAPEDAAVAKE